MPAYYSNYWDKPSSVYRLYDAEGRLLYVGLARRPENRIYAHKRKPWGHLINSMAVEWFDDREAAKAAERTAIHHEEPIHNLARPRMGCC